MTIYSNQSKAELINWISSHMVNIIIRFFKNIKKPTQCDVCMEHNPIVKLCNCTFHICSTCIQSINNENLIMMPENRQYRSFSLFCCASNFLVMYSFVVVMIL